MKRTSLEHALTVKSNKCSSLKSYSLGWLEFIGRGTDIRVYDSAAAWMLPKNETHAQEKLESFLPHFHAPGPRSYISTSPHLSACLQRPLPNSDRLGRGSICFDRKALLILLVLPRSNRGMLFLCMFLLSTAMTVVLVLNSQAMGRRRLGPVEVTNRIPRTKGERKTEYVAQHRKAFRG